MSQYEVDLEYGSLLKACPTLSNGTKLYRCVVLSNYNYFRLKWVLMQGMKFQDGSVVVLGSDILLTFGHIIDIVVVDVNNPL